MQTNVVKRLQLAHIQSQQQKHKKVLSPNLTANQQNHSSTMLFFKDNSRWGKGSKKFSRKVLINIFKQTHKLNNK